MPPYFPARGRGTGKAHPHRWLRLWHRANRRPGKKRNNPARRQNASGNEPLGVFFLFQQQGGAEIKTLEGFGITGQRVAGAPGIYVRLADPFSHAMLQTAALDPFVGLGKISALGIKVSNHRTYHGVALNVAMDLEPYSRINPCGYAGLKTIDLSTIGLSVAWSEAAQLLGQKLATYLAP